MRCSNRWEHVQFNYFRRREFITLLGGAAAAWPLAGRAQQPGMRVIGFLSAGSPGDSVDVVDVLRRGLTDAGLIVGYNVAIEFRWVEGQFDHLSALAAELVNRRVAVIFAVTNAAALAAKAATATIPIVFAIGGDPVSIGLVSNLNRPGGNITGISAISSGLDSKRVELLHQLVPDAKLIGILINPADPSSYIESREALSAARTLGLQLQTMSANNDSDLEVAFVSLRERPIGALLIPNDAFFNSRRGLLVGLAARHSVPTLYPWREYAEAGGLMSYGPSLSSGYRQATVYLSRILRGAKPADLPVWKPNKFELVINSKTAKALGITIAQPLLVSATQVIQ
jgi:ABC-type uncharacterized transport system substrate-binding protein